MAQGIAGDTNAFTIDGLPYQDLQIVELRTISSLLQNLLGSNQALDEINVLRNDNAFVLGIGTPLPGTFQ